MGERNLFAAPSPRRDREPDARTLPGAMLFAFFLIVLFVLGDVTRAYNHPSQSPISPPWTLLYFPFYLSLIVGMVRRNRFSLGFTIVLFLISGFGGTVLSENPLLLINVTPAALLLFPSSLAYFRRA